jgi:hypothetical protein
MSWRTIHRLKKTRAHGSEERRKNSNPKESKTRENISLFFVTEVEESGDSRQKGRGKGR